MTQVILTHIPSKLIRLALNDLRICENQPDKYKIDMGTWHKTYASGLCSICLAGSVMANTTNENFYYSYYSQRIPLEDEVNAGCYIFLDKMWQVECRDAMLKGCNYIDATPISWDKVIPSYKTDKEGFHKAMNELADAFEASGQ